jgi:hypothetical protein
MDYVPGLKPVWTDNERIAFKFKLSESCYDYGNRRVKIGVTE